MSMTETIEATPHMDPEGLACFQDALKSSQCYLEYGSGGSTVCAATVAHVPQIISVESDQNWIERVRSTLSTTASNLCLEHCDIGPVGDWGSPINNDHVQNFWRYMTTPWNAARAHRLFPDTVLIDGRFRVASLLYTLISARAGTTILFDDYFDRPRYFVVEEFCQYESRRGRMAVFSLARNFSFTTICEKIAQYSVLSQS